MATYGSVTGVEHINSHYVGGYTTTGMPATSAVVAWLAQGYAALNVYLGKAGYATPVSTSAACYAVLTRLNDLYAAACAEQATNISTAGPGEETRSEKLWQRFKVELADFLDGDLTLVGLSRGTTAPVRARVRSLELRRRDGYAKRFDPDNTEYAASETDDITLLEPWRLSDSAGRAEGDY